MWRFGHFLGRYATAFSRQQRGRSIITTSAIRQNKNKQQRQDSSKNDGSSSNKNNAGSVYDHLLKTMITYTVPFLLAGVASWTYNRTNNVKKQLQEDKLSEMTGIQDTIINFNKKKRDFIKLQNLNDKLKTYSYIIDTHTKGKLFAEKSLKHSPALDFLKTQLKLPDEKITAVYDIYLPYIAVLGALLQAEKVAQINMKQSIGFATLESDKTLSEKQAKIMEIVKKQADLQIELSKSLSKILSEEEFSQFKAFQAEYELNTTTGYKDIIPVTKTKHVFVLNFDGDMEASQVGKLREEITAVILNASKEDGDEVVLNLNSGGGTVTGYGLAAAQLDRIRQAGLPLSVCVDQVAASGGYMMACVADRLYASPFAVLGSVGVVTTIPNFSERLTREGIIVDDVTAGKYKRTMTPFKQPTEEDRNKVQSELEDILKIFKSFIAVHRPALNVDDIATGEVWFGKDALDRGLVDTLRTSDDVVLDFIKRGAQVYSVKYVRLPSNSVSSFLFSDFISNNVNNPIISTFLKWLIGSKHSDLLNLPSDLMLELPNKELLSPHAAGAGDIRSKYLMQYTGHIPRS